MLSIIKVIGVKFKELAKKINTKQFHSIVLYEDKYLKTKIKEYDGRITTKFNNMRMDIILVLHALLLIRY